MARTKTRLVYAVSGKCLGTVDNGPTLFGHRYRGIVPNEDGTAPGRVLIETDSINRAEQAIRDYWENRPKVIIDKTTGKPVTRETVAARFKSNAKS